MSTHIRSGFSSVRPYIHGPLDLVEFVQSVFDAKLLDRHDSGPQSAHVELQIDDSVVVIEAGTLPQDFPTWTNSVYVYVENVDLVYRRAIEMGAKSIAEPGEKHYAERQAGFRDCGGNTWWVATCINQPPLF